MSEFHVVQPNAAPNYRSVSEKMSPELREAFLNACLVSGLSEDDSIHAVLAFQSELLASGFATQTAALKAILDGFVSARKSENKALAELLQANQVASREFVGTIRQSSFESLSAVGALGKESREGRAALEKNLTEIQRKADEQSRTVTSAARTLTEEVKVFRATAVTWVWSFIGIAMFLGALLVFVIDRWPR